jgi:hypothetical protein
MRFGSVNDPELLRLGFAVQSKVGAPASAHDVGPSSYVMDYVPDPALVTCTVGRPAIAGVGAEHEFRTGNDAFERKLRQGP